MAAPPDDFTSYLAISAGSFQGFSRLVESRVAQALAEIAIRWFSSHPFEEMPSEVQALPFAPPLASLRPSILANYDAVVPSSFLVYAHAVLDSFLTETTRFLLLRDPKLLGEKTPVSWLVFVDPDQHWDAILRTVNRRVREVAFWPLLGRIEFLIKTFNLPIDFPHELREDLVRFANLRNSVVHDHATFDLRKAPNGAIAAFRRQEIQSAPTEQEASLAVHTFCRTAAVLFLSVCDSPLNGRDHPAYAVATEISDILLQFPVAPRGRTDG